jgi:hypothetical protein
MHDIVFPSNCGECNRVHISVHYQGALSDNPLDRETFASKVSWYQTWPYLNMCIDYMNEPGSGVCCTIYLIQLLKEVVGKGPLFLCALQTLGSAENLCLRCPPDIIDCHWPQYRKKSRLLPPSQQHPCCR